jgi:hypothetical protein
MSGMLTEYHKLAIQPFGMTPDPRFLYPSGTHREAIKDLDLGTMNVPSRKNDEQSSRHSQRSGGVSSPAESLPERLFAAEILASLAGENLVRFDFVAQRVTP